MAELHYDVVLSGDVLEGFSFQQVMDNLVDVFNLTESRREQLLREKHSIFASDLAFEQATEYLQKLKSIGIDAYLIRHGQVDDAVKNEPAAIATTAENNESPAEPLAAKANPEQPPPNTRAVPFIFNGDGGEYFRIWIVNIALTILTLGIYSAWAKVRNKQYFYGNTELDNASFVYRAEPIQILKGRLIAFAFFAAYILFGSLMPGIELVFAVIFLFAFPWLVVKSLAFNAHYSEYRNVRFGFDGRYAEAWGVFIGWPILAVLSLGLLFPYVAYKQQTFMVNKHRYGNTSFQFEPGVAAYYIIFLMIIGVTFASSIVIGISSAVLTAISPEMSVVSTGILSMMMYLLLFVFYSVRVTNLRYNYTQLGPHSFSAYWTTPSYFSLVFFNTLLSVLTLGLFIPWAKVRTAKYQAEHLNMDVAGDLDQFSADIEQDVGAFGEGMSDVFDFDVGL